MSHVEVLFFAADPLSVAPATRPRLLIDEEARQIREKVRLAKYRDRLRLNTHWATRTDDLMQAFNETQPQVVHFSGHCGSGGLVLVAADGTREHRVDTEGLREFFRLFSGRIRLVVLNACMSLPQAQAIADVVGCAIGTPDQITDGAAVVFAASFYRAIAFGHSVQTAFDQARAAVKLERYEDRECPRLLHRKGVDPRRLVLIPAPHVRRVAVPALALLLIAGTVATVASVIHDRVGRGTRTAGTSASAPVDTVVGVPADTSVSMPASTTTHAPDSVPALDSASAAVKSIGSPEPGTLADARDLYEAGDHVAAFPLFRAAAEAGSTEAMAFLGIAYLNGQGTERQPRQAVQWLTRAAEAGDPRGMNVLGVAYQEGTGVDKNLRLAKHWFEEAARREYVPAMLNLGGYYRQFEGPQYGYQQAMVWYRKAAEAGSLDAMVNVGMMFERGMGVRQDSEEALRWHLLAAEAGSARGMSAAGRAYQQQRDYARARSWFLKGVDAESAEAMNDMGVLYFNGWGVPRDRGEAARWFRRAAQAGSSEAAGNLAAMGAN